MVVTRSDANLLEFLARLEIDKAPPPTLEEIAECYPHVTLEFLEARTSWICKVDDGYRLANDGWWVVEEGTRGDHVELRRPPELRKHEEPIPTATPTGQAWFVVYETQHHYARSNGLSVQIGEWTRNNVVIRQHPVLWLAELNVRYGESSWVALGKPMGGPHACWEKARLLFFDRLDPEVLAELLDYEGRDAAVGFDIHRGKA